VQVTCRKLDPVLTGRSYVLETSDSTDKSFGIGSAQPELSARYPAWYALYTCARHEKRVASQLVERSLESFLPLYRSVRRWNDRSRLVDLPLFPGYLFVHIPLTEKLRVLSIRGAVRLVEWGGSPQALLDEEVQQIRQLLLGRMQIEPHPYIKAGARVRITRGSLEGTEGYVVRFKNMCRVVISVHLIQRSIAVELDSEDIAAIPDLGRNRDGFPNMFHDYAF